MIDMRNMEYENHIAYMSYMMQNQFSASVTVPCCRLSDCVSRLPNHAAVMLCVQWWWGGAVCVCVCALGVCLCVRGCLCVGVCASGAEFSHCSGPIADIAAALAWLAFALNWQVMLMALATRTLS